MHEVRLRRLPALCRSDRGRRSRDQSVPSGRCSRHRALAQLLDRAPLPLNPVNGFERPLTVAVIDESRCIGCTLCIPACPVDAIVGSAKRMHSVIALAVHRLRLVSATLSDGLHFNGSSGAASRVDRGRSSRRARTARRATRTAATRDCCHAPLPTTTREQRTGTVAAAIARAQQRRGTAPQ